MRYWIVWISLFTFGAISLAQTATCPVQVSGAFTATELICKDTRDGQACIGNGVVEASPREGATITLSQPGDKTTFTDISELRLRTSDTENRLWSVAQIQHRLQTSGSQTLTARFIAFGDVTLADDGDKVEAPVDTSSGQRTGKVLAEFGLIIRKSPDPASGVVWQLRAGEQITVTGQTADKTWLRVNVPSGFGGSGWVYAYYVEVAGGQETLPFVDANSPRPTPLPPPPQPEYGTMQAFKLITSDSSPDCPETPHSGVLVQSPNGMLEEMKLRVNGVAFEFNGTIFLQAQANASLRISVLEGVAFVGSDRVTVNASSVAVVNMGSNLEPLSAPSVEPLDVADVAFFPANLLPRLVVLLQPDVASAPADVVTEAPEATVESAPLDVASAPVDVATESPTASPTPNDSGSIVLFPTAMPSNALPVEPVATATPENVLLTAKGSLISTQLEGELCGKGAQNITQTAPAFGISAEVGGIWTAKAGTSISIEVLGGTFQSGLGHFIRLLSVQGILAQSGDQQQLTYTFEQDTRFNVSVSAKAGDNLIVTVTCNN